MKEELISFKTAKLAKEKGFDWESLCYYTDEVEKGIYQNDDFYDWNNCDSSHELCPDVYCSAPTQSLLQKWLKEEHGIIAYIDWWCMEGIVLTSKGKEYEQSFITQFTMMGNEDLELLLVESLKLIQ